MTFKAAELNVFQIHSTIDGELHHAMRLERLRLRHGLQGPLASTIAALAYGGQR
jgi:uncharacterized protein YjaZ